MLSIFAPTLPVKIFSVRKRQFIEESVKLALLLMLAKDFSYPKPFSLSTCFSSSSLSYSHMGKKKGELTVQ